MQPGTCAITGHKYDGIKDREDDVVIYHDTFVKARAHCLALKLDTDNVRFSQRVDKWYFIYTK